MTDDELQWPFDDGTPTSPEAEMLEYLRTWLDHHDPDASMWQHAPEHLRAWWQATLDADDPREAIATMSFRLVQLVDQDHGALRAAGAFWFP